MLSETPQMRKSLGQHRSKVPAAAHPDLIVTSSETKFGIDTLRAEIETIVRT
jgi:hypothetical protein